MKTAYLALKVATGVACVYEAVTIGLSMAGGPDATISHNVDLRWPIGVVILSGLGVHFYWRRLAQLWAWLRSL